MRKTKDVREFDFFLNFKTGRTIKLEDKLLLIDNLDENIVFNISEGSNYHKEILKQDIPIKINLAIVLFCLEGEMRLQLNLKDLTVKKNCIFVMLPGSIGKLYYVSDNFRVACIFFSNDNYKPSLNIKDIIESQHLIFNHPIFEIKEERMNEFADIYCALCKKLSDVKFKYKQELTDAYLQVLKIYWEDCIDLDKINVPQSKISRQKVILDAFLNEIVKHYQKERNVAFYADKLCISPKYLSKVVKDISNRKPSDWIRELVILEAKALLRTQQYSVQQISEQLNFTSASFFGRYFREAVGCTPRKYQSEM